MPDILLVIIASLIGGLLSTTGGFLLLVTKKHFHFSEFASAFAAGALLAAAFVDLLPEALEHGHENEIFTPVLVLVGILGFFIIENLIHWFHHHRHNTNHKPADAVVHLIIIGDTIHNFIDGIAIAAGFLVDPTTGIIVTLAVAAHEIPQEIGDFGLLLNKGLSSSKVIIINILSSFATTASAIIFFLLGSSIHIETEPVLALTAGFFIYIALSDIIPSIHQERNRKTALVQSLILLLGVVAVSLSVFILHGFMD